MADSLRADHPNRSPKLTKSQKKRQRRRRTSAAPADPEYEEAGENNVLQPPPAQPRKLPQPPAARVSKPPRHNAPRRETTENGDISRLCATVEAQLEIMRKQQESIERLLRQSKPQPPSKPLPPVPSSVPQPEPLPRQSGPVADPKRGKTVPPSPETKITVGKLSAAVKEAVRLARYTINCDASIQVADAKALAHLWLVDPTGPLVLPTFHSDYPVVALVPTTLVGEDDTIAWLVSKDQKWVWWVDKSTGKLRRHPIPLHAEAKRVGPWILTDPTVPFEHSFEGNWEWHTHIFAPSIWACWKRGWTSFRRFLNPQRVHGLVNVAIETSVRDKADQKREKMTEKSMRQALASRYDSDLLYQMLSKYFHWAIEETVDLSVERTAWGKVHVLNERREAVVDNHHSSVVRTRELEASVYGSEPAINAPRYWREALGLLACCALLAWQWRNTNVGHMRWAASLKLLDVLKALQSRVASLATWTLGDVVSGPARAVRGILVWVLSLLRAGWRNVRSLTVHDIASAPLKAARWFTAPFTQRFDAAQTVLIAHTPGGDPRVRAQEFARMILSWNGIYTLFLVPFAEELLKRTFCGHPFGSLVVFYLCAREGPVNLIKHALCLLWPFPMAVAFHSFNNALAFWIGHHEPQIWSPTNVHTFLNIPVTPMMWPQSRRFARYFQEPLVAGAVGLGVRLLEWWHGPPAPPPGRDDQEVIDALVDQLTQLQDHPVDPLPINLTQEFVTGGPIYWPRAQAFCSLKPPGSFPVTFNKKPLYWPPVHNDYVHDVNPIHVLIKFGYFEYAAPARTEYNLYMVMRTRMLVDPPLEEHQQVLAWAAMTDVPVPEFPPIPFTTEESYEEFVEHMPSAKRAAYRRMYADICDHPTLPHERLGAVEVMVKTDEILMRNVRVGEYVQFELKPRAISNVHMSVSATLGPYIYAATGRLKETWSGYVPIRMGDWTFYPTFASSFTDAQLTEVFMFALSVATDKVAHIFVAGDDSLIVTGDEGGYRFIEGDFSMFDSCQGRGPLEAEYRILRRLGVPEGYLHMLEKSNAAPWVARFRHAGTKMSIHRPPMRNTGGVDTTIGNSIVNMALWTNSLVQVGLYGNHAAYFSAKGFEIKLALSTEPTEPTFLKGKWWRASHNHLPESSLVWAPLPSRLLKMGKAFTHPERLYGGKGRNAAIAFLHDSAVSQASFLQVPLLSAFVRKWSSPIHARCGHAPELDDPYKVIASGNYADWTSNGYEDVCLRYDVDFEDVSSCEAMVAAAEPWSVLAHPLFTIMMGRDYNGWT